MASPFSWRWEKISYWTRINLLFQFAPEKLGRFERQCWNFLAFQNVLFFSNSPKSQARPISLGLSVYGTKTVFFSNKIFHYFLGKVNEVKTEMRLKWGVGRLIADSKVTPIVIPIYHQGMDSILPNRTPYWWVVYLITFDSNLGWNAQSVLRKIRKFFVASKYFCKVIYCNRALVFDFHSSHQTLVI